MLAEKVTLEYYRIPEYDRNRKIMCCILPNIEHKTSYKIQENTILKLACMGDYRNNSEPNHKVESYYWAVLPMAGQSVFGHLCRKTPGGGKTRGLGQRTDVLTYLYFIRFSLAWTVIFLYLAHNRAFALCFIQSF